MSSSSDIQKSIDSAISSRLSWNGELMTLNKQIAEAKTVSLKAKLRRQIRNAEEQVKDLDKLISRLSNDLQKVARSEDKAAHKDILAAQGKTKLGVFAESAGDIIKEIIPMTTDVPLEHTSGSLPVTTRSSGTEVVTPGPETKNNKTMIYLIIGAVILLLISKK
jgi:TolA-binding protein